MFLSWYRFYIFRRLPDDKKKKKKRKRDDDSDDDLGIIFPLQVHRGITYLYPQNLIAERRINRHHPLPNHILKHLFPKLSSPLVPLPYLLKR